MRRRTTAAELTSLLEGEIARGWMWMPSLMQMVVGTKADLRIFVRIGNRRGRLTRELIDMCPHCFIEEQIVRRLAYAEADALVAGYRQNLAADRATQVQLLRLGRAARGGTGWVVTLHASGPGRKVAYSPDCVVHHPATQGGTEEIERASPDPMLPGGLRAELNGVVAMCRFLGMPDELIDDHTIVSYVYPAFVEVFAGTAIDRDPLTYGVGSEDPDIWEHAEWFGTGLPRKGRLHERMVVVRDQPGHPGQRFLRDPSHLFGAMLAADLHNGMARFRSPQLPFLTTRGTEVQLAATNSDALWRMSLEPPAPRIVSLAPTAPIIASSIDDLIERCAGSDTDEAADCRFVSDETVLRTFASAYYTFALDAIDDAGRRREDRTPPTIGPIDSPITNAARDIAAGSVDLVLCHRPAGDIPDKAWTNIRAALTVGGRLCIAVPDPTIEVTETVAVLHRIGLHLEPTLVDRPTGHTMMFLAPTPPGRTSDADAR